jgi:Cdc6-like AAA superfamily ATPase
MSKPARARQPVDDEGWSALRDEMLSLFTPGAPIDEYALFAGRQPQIQKISDTVVSKGRHAVLFGERGVGKTSLASIFYLGFPETRPVVYVYVQCGSADTYQEIWQRALRRIVFTIDGKEFIAADLIRGAVTPDELEVVLANFASAHLPVIVFDEFDRIRDQPTKVMMSETIKHLSNSPTSCTIILVGVADNVTDIIAEHQSISRALVQIRMPRMHPDELKQIVTSRLRGTPLSVTDDALWRISYLASGLPFYAHALGQAAAITAIQRRKIQITEEIVNASIDNCFDDLDHTLIDAYVKAITETRKGNIFKHVLAACALAEQDELGRFSAASVEAPLSEIIGRPMKAPSFSFHLNELCNPERGTILAKTGSRSHYRFRFVQPMIQPFITMKSLSTGVMDDAVLARFAIERQRELSI